MANKKAKPNQVIKCETGRGVIKDNALAALVTSNLFRMQVVAPKKGKGAFKRAKKHKGQESYLNAA